MEQFSNDRQVFEGKARDVFPLDFEITRQLTATDIYIRETLGAEVSVPKIKSLRAMHHRLAQCLAMNFSYAEASVATGYTPSRISRLNNDPSFLELLAFYREKSIDVFVDVQQRMAGFATTAVEVLQERLEDKPDTFSNKDLNELIKTTADRGGHSPVHKTEVRATVLTASDLEKLKQEVVEKHNGSIRRINQAEESQRVKEVLGQVTQNSEGIKISSNDNGPTKNVFKEAEAEGSAGQGSDI